MPWTENLVSFRFGRGHNSASGALITGHNSASGALITGHNSALITEREPMQRLSPYWPGDVPPVTGSLRQADAATGPVCCGTAKLLFPKSTAWADATT